MARTFRRMKSKKGSHNQSSGKHYLYDCQENEYGVYEFILSEGKEYQKNWHRYHGDNDRNAYTPARYYRQRRESELRSVNKSELLKFMNKDDYEPICRENPKSHYWDWS